jgi:nicotinate-nucleotide adenylyltransferase
MAGPWQWAGAALTLTGLLGGSFNPAHGGHRAISLFVREALELDEIWWLVSPGNPLKADAKDMAPLPARLASARKMARRAPIRVTAIEAQMGTRYTIDTLQKLVRRYPHRRFIWIMGADNVANFTRWRRWRDIARLMPIAVVARPGYGGSAVAGAAMAWLRRFVRRSDQRLNWTMWSTPALVFLRFSPDLRSATAYRQANPDWHRDYEGKRVIDGVTHKSVY